MMNENTESIHTDYYIDFDDAMSQKWNAKHKLKLASVLPC